MATNIDLKLNDQNIDLKLQRDYSLDLPREINVQSYDQQHSCLQLKNTKQ